jgi:hypothetical protein
VLDELVVGRLALEEVAQLDSGRQAVGRWDLAYRRARLFRQSERVRVPWPSSGLPANSNV